MGLFRIEEQKTRLIIEEVDCISDALDIQDKNFPSTVVRDIDDVVLSKHEPPRRKKNKVARIFLDKIRNVR